MFSRGRGFDGIGRGWRRSPQAGGHGGCRSKGGVRSLRHDLVLPDDHPEECGGQDDPPDLKVPGAAEPLDRAAGSPQGHHVDVVGRELRDTLRAGGGVRHQPYPERLSRRSLPAPAQKQDQDGGHAAGTIRRTGAESVPPEKPDARTSAEEYLRVSCANHSSTGLRACYPEDIAGTITGMASFAQRTARMDKPSIDAAMKVYFIH